MIIARIPTDNPAEAACRSVGGPIELARLMGVSRQTIYIWTQTEKIPAHRVDEVAKVSGISPNKLRKR